MGEGTLAQARKYLALGLSMIPLHPKDKRPHLTQWDQYQKRLPKDVELDSWFNQTDNNLAVVCGAVSGNLVVIDFDDEQAFKFHFGDISVLVEDSIVVKTAKGVHIYLRTEEPVKQTTLRAKTEKGPSLPVDIKAEGGYVVAPPSIHPSGTPYTFIGKGEKVLKLSKETWEKFYNDLKNTAYEWPLAERIIPLWVEGVRQNLAMGVAGFLRKQMGYDQDRATKFMEALCRATDDSEIRQRLSVIDATYQKDVDTVAVRNWLGDGLADLLFGQADGLKPKKKKKEREKEKEEEEKMTAFRVEGNFIYRQVVEDGVPKFAKFDRQKKEVVGYVEKTEVTGEIPIAVRKSASVMFPRRLIAYGSPGELYRRLKEKIKYASDQKGHLMDVFALYLMYHGCSPPFERKNFQIIAMGQPASGKSRIGELAKLLGDRARNNISLKNATAYRMNDMLGGGLLIIDETPKDDEELEMLIRGRWDPDFFVERIIDPHDPTAIHCFRMSGPTIIILRQPYTDDANTDRGIILPCEKGEEFPLELLQETRDQYHDVLDMLALFWTEHYNDPRLLPTQQELWYPKGEKLDPRLKTVVIYLSKLAQLISPEAVADLEGFANEQVMQRIRMKSTTATGQAVRAFYELLMELKEGRSWTKTLKSGEQVKVKDELAIDFRGDRIIPYINRTTNEETKVTGISWSMIAERMQTATRQDPGKILQQYSLEVIRVRVVDKVVRTVAFHVDPLDRGFRTFIEPDQFDEHWADFGQKETPTISKGQQTLPQEEPVASTPVVGVPLPPLEQQTTQTYEEFKAEFDVMLKTITDKGCDSELAEWAIKLMADRMKEGDRTSAYLLRNEAKRNFSERADEVTEAVDRLFADFEKAARLVYKARNVRQNAK